MTRRSAVLWILFFLIGEGEVWSQTGLKKITIISSSRSIVYIDLYVAQERGFFRDEGLEAELVEVRSANIAIAALMSGEVDAVAGVGTILGAIYRGMPAKVLTVMGNRALFWLVSRPNFKSIPELKGRTLGVTTQGGSQHQAALHLLRAGGLDPVTDLSTVVIGGAPTLLQALVRGPIQVTALSPPTIVVARDTFKMNVLAEPPKDFVRTQGGLAVTEKYLSEKKDLVRKMLRARTRGHKYIHENERGASESLAKYTKLDLPIAIETYRISRFGLTRNGVLTEKEVEELLKEDARIFGLSQPVPASMVFDFSMQKEINREFGIQ